MCFYSHKVQIQVKNRDKRPLAHTPIHLHTHTRPHTHTISLQYQLLALLLEKI